MSQKTDLLAIRNGVKKANLPAEVQTTVLWHMDKLPDLYQKLETTFESRFLDEILRHVHGMLKTISVPSSIEAVTNRFRAMHERHGIPSLGLKRPVAAQAEPTRSRKVSTALSASI